MRERIECYLPIQCGCRIAAPFRDQCVRGFVARSGEEKNDVVNEDESEKLRRQLRHPGTVEVRASVCKLWQWEKFLSGVAVFCDRMIERRFFLSRECPGGSGF